MTIQPYLCVKQLFQDRDGIMIFRREHREHRRVKAVLSSAGSTDSRHEQRWSVRVYSPENLVFEGDSEFVTVLLRTDEPRRNVEAIIEREPDGGNVT